MLHHALEYVQPVRPAVDQLFSTPAACLQHVECRRSLEVDSVLGLGDQPTHACRHHQLLQTLEAAHGDQIYHAVRQQGGHVIDHLPRLRVVKLNVSQPVAQRELRAVTSAGVADRHTLGATQRRHPEPIPADWSGRAECARLQPLGALGELRQRVAE